MGYGVLQSQTYQKIQQLERRVCALGAEVVKCKGSFDRLMGENESLRSEISHIYLMSRNLPEKLSNYSQL